REYTADEKRYYRLLSETKYEMDHYNRMADAEERGIRIGEELGRAAERERAEAKIAAEREKAEAKMTAERERAEAKMTAAVDALRAAGVPEEVIARAYPSAD
ncbi:MAG: hypothetical protein LBB57_03030, partial [Clostridiales Family XIII bacterium]|nr:hypothetical protein [Clostridiales Family XIII bacterium]